MLLATPSRRKYLYNRTKSLQHRRQSSLCRRVSLSSASRHPAVRGAPRWGTVVAIGGYFSWRSLRMRPLRALMAANSGTRLATPSTSERVRRVCHNMEASTSRGVATSRPVTVPRLSSDSGPGFVRVGEWSDTDRNLATGEECDRTGQSTGAIGIRWRGPPSRRPGRRTRVDRHAGGAGSPPHRHLGIYEQGVSQLLFQGLYRDGQQHAGCSGMVV